MVYQVTLQHALGKVTREQVEDVIGRIHPPGAQLDFSMQGDRILVRSDDQVATVEYGPDNISIIPGTPRMATLTRLGYALVVPGILLARMNRRRNQQLTGMATMACMAGLEAEPVGNSEGMFSEVSPEEWEAIRDNMGLSEVSDPFSDQTSEPIGFFETVPEDHWTPPSGWQGQVDTEGIEWLTYPSGSPQTFVRDTPGSEWAISGLTLQRTYDGDVAELINQYTSTIDLRYPLWFKLAMTVLLPLDTVMLFTIIFLLLEPVIGTFPFV